MILSQKINKSSGLSLPIATGLVSLLMIGAVAANQSIIKTLNAVHQIEASNRAYSIAEAGVEDALYELSAHFAGYETPPLLDPQARQVDFSGGKGEWKNRWSIQSHGVGPSCAPGIDLCGTLANKRKLSLSLFNDIEGKIKTLGVGAFKITFRIPETLVNDPDLNPAFLNGLIVDNDGDAWITNKDNGVNEDAEGESGKCLEGGGNQKVIEGKDADCDDKEDEDSAEDPVIYWKISDDAGRSLVPKRGCLLENDPKKLLGSEICEKNFQALNNEVSFTIDETIVGIREDGSEEKIRDFLALYDQTKTDKLQLEFLVVAPLEQVDFNRQKKIPLPHFEYEIIYQADAILPAPLFLIEVDGFYRGFKQSITTTLTPKTTVPLLDFTVIQQQ